MARGSGKNSLSGKRRMGHSFLAFDDNIIIAVALTAGVTASAASSFHSAHRGPRWSHLESIGRPVLRPPPPPPPPPPLSSLHRTVSFHPDSGRSIDIGRPHWNRISDRGRDLNFRRLSVNRKNKQRSMKAADEKRKRTSEEEEEEEEEGRPETSRW